MFEDSLMESDARKKARRRWITFPVSIILHALILAVAVLGPFLTADTNLPPVKVINVFMAAAPPPPPPPPPPAKKKTNRETRREERPEAEAQRPIIAGRLVAPIEIPEEIADEEVSDFGFDFGVDGGVEGGVEGGVVGGVLGGPGTGDGSITASAIQIASIQQPKLIKRVEPQFPSVALKAHIEGVVVINATTDIYGRVVDARVITGHPLLRQAAVAAINQWVYEPYILNGVPRPVKFTVTIKFNLSNR